jgi:cytochrome d ubiquinol oxidase subunit II
MNDPSALAGLGAVAPLTLACAGVLALAVIMYVLLDGFDLGIGLLFPFAPSTEARDHMMAAVAPVWDGNETWLVLGGTVLFATFPAAYATLLPALYLPLLVMLVGLVFRGVCFEFRAHGRGSRRWWSVGFFGGSLAATLAQGAILATFVAGIDSAEPGHPWATPFVLPCAFGLAAGYGLLGAAWTVLKTEGEVQAWAWRWLPPLVLAVLAAGLVVSLWTPFLQEWVWARWFSWPAIAAVAPAPVVAVGLALAMIQATRSRRHDSLPFLAALGIFLCSFYGLAVTLWPYAVPPVLTLEAAAAAPSSQIFVLAGLAVLVPVTLGYTAYTYRVFRGKVGGGY